MKTIKLILTGAVLLTIFAMGCSPGDPEQTALSITQPSGPAALQRYVAIGNSISAGYMDSGLIINGQLSSFPFQIALQLGYSPDPSSDDWFAQPLTAWPGIGTTDVGDPTLVAGVLHWNGSSIEPVGVTPLAQVQSLLQATQYPTPYPNLGIPGAYSLDVEGTLDSSESTRPNNAYFDSILRNPTFGNVDMLNQAIAQGPTLVTLWIGSNDVLLGATGGNPVVGENVIPAAVVAEAIEGAVAGLDEGVHARFGYHPHLVVGNIPSITSVPYFIPKAVFDNVVGLPFPSEEENVEFVTFPALGEVTGGAYAELPSHRTLTADETSAVETTVADINAAIDDLAGQYGYTVADANALLAGLSTPEATHFVFLVGQGMTVEQAAATTRFSLDGFHPNNRGQTLLANLFIEGINTELGLSGGDALVPVPDTAVWDPTYPEPLGAAALAAAGR
jgi:lysophospholipase L1-like esterase